MLSRLALLGPVCLTGPHTSCIRRASQRRRTALLALLASPRGAPVSRDRLLGILWPDRDERSARHLLADSLYVLRQTLGDEAIVASGESLQLSPDVVWTDVVEFRAALADERWSDALDLYRGDFLDGFFVRNAADFDQWATTERSRLQLLATKAASALADELCHAGRIPDAAAAAERALELSSCDETLFRNLIRLLIAADNPARAEALALAFVERLATNLGIAPSAETMRVIREARGRPNSEPIVVIAPRPRASQKDRRPIDSVTASIVAHGRHHWHRRTRSSIERAIEYFSRALERDPRSVDALCGIADSWIVLGGRGHLPVAAAIEHAAPNVERALALDDKASSVFASLGGLNMLRRRWRDAESALRRAILVNPENPDARHWLSLTLLAGFGERESAIHEQTIATSLNPVSPTQVGALGWQQYLLGAYDLSRSNMALVMDLTADLDDRRDPLPERASALAVLENRCSAPSGVAPGVERFSAAGHLFWL